VGAKRLAHDAVAAAARCRSGRDLLTALFFLNKTKQREVEARVEC
jgi:hypothetical protein